MTVPGNLSSPLLASAAGAAGAFEISRSLRFNASDSSFLNRTPSSAGNRKTWTWSGWIKKSGQSANQFFFGAGPDDGGNTNQIQFFFMPNDKFRITTAQVVFRETTQVFRDPSSFLHLVVAFDTTQSTANDRIKIYINGSQVTDFSSTNNPAQNADTGVNSAADHRIGQGSGASYSGSSYAFNGYLSEVNFIDGSALDPTSFGAFDANGVWQGIDTAGLSFGTNGFRLKFADNSSSSALGTDSSGNSNSWTVNNLSVGAVSNPTAKQNFDVVTYSGTGSAQSIGGLAFQPDFVWLKSRSSSYNNAVFDSVRGVQKRLQPNLTQEEDVGSTGLSAFNTDGFTVGSNNVNGANGVTYVAWAWKAGGAAVSNTDGTITSQVSVNNDYGFSICSFNSPAAYDSSTWGHGLSSAPKWVILKRLDGSSAWTVYHAGDPSHYFFLNSSNAGAGSNNWTVTSTTVAPGAGLWTALNAPHIAYCWSEVAGFSKFGSYSGSGSSGNTITTGFKPRYLIIKRTDSTGDWWIWDTARGDNKFLYANSAAAGNANDAVVGSYPISATSTGFSIDNTADLNQSGATYIYAAYAATVDESAINDCFVDTPQNAADPTDSGIGGEIVGNYCTLNPLRKHADSGAAGHTLANGNLDITATAGACGVGGTIGMSGGGRYYWEVTYKTGTEFFAGIIDAASETKFLNAYTGWSHYGHLWGPKNSVFFDWTGGGAASTSISSAVSDGDIMGMALDLDNNSLQYYKNGAAVGSARSVTAGKTWTAWIASGNNTYNNLTCSVNFGQRSFSHNAPTNFKSLNTANLPTPTIADGSQYFDTKVYTGNGGTQSISGLNFSPDWIWFKQRNTTRENHLYDIVRGVQKAIYTDLTNAEATDTDALSSFNSDGWTMGADGGSNANGGTYVAWAWDGGTSTVTNNDGSIASQVRAQPSAGFSICTYSGSGSNGSFGHGLNAVPGLVIVKCRNNAQNWAVQHSAYGPTKYTYLNSTIEARTTGAAAFWNNTAPTNSTVSVGTDNDTNASGKTYVAYCFAPVSGYSAMGKYTGNGSSDGVFVHTGFRPSLILTKRTDSSADWLIHDSSRATYNVAGEYLIPNANTAEQDGNKRDFLSNGFKLRSSGGAVNASGGTYIYYAVSENPFQANGGLAR